MFIHYCNTSFDFDIGGALPEKLKAPCAEMTLYSFFSASGNDRVILDVVVDGDYRARLLSFGFTAQAVSAGVIYPGMNARLWGVSPQALERVHSIGADTGSLPSASIAKRVNSREFSSQLARHMGYPAAGVICRSVGEFDALLSAEKRRPLLVKPLFGSSGSGFVPVNMNRLGERERMRCLRIIAGGVCVEPLLARIADFGVNFTVSDGGTFLLEGMHTSLISPSGKFTGIDLEEPPEQYRDMLMSAAESAAAALYKEGYTGPAGIDAFSYIDDDGVLRLNPMCEINARLSMGFTARSCRNILGGKYVSLRQLRTPKAFKCSDYAALDSLFGRHMYDAKKREGMLILTPLHRSYRNDRQPCMFTLVYTAASSQKLHLEYAAALQQFIDR